MRSARVAPGGASSMVLGDDRAEWTTNSSAHGQCESTSATLEAPLTRVGPGGTDSIEFGASAESAPLAELLARQAPGGQAQISLGVQSNDWHTESSMHGVGSVDAVVSAAPVSRHAPGGMDSINFGATAVNPSVNELLQRAAPGGMTQVVLGGDSYDWSTNSSVHGTGCVDGISSQVSARQAPGGVDSIKFGATPHNESVETLLAKNCPGGNATIVLGGHAAEWKTNSSANGVGSFAAVAQMEALVREAPGGADNVDFGATGPAGPSSDALLARPSVGGSDSVAFGVSDTSNLPAEALLARPSPGGASNLVLGSESGTWTTHSSAHGIGSIEAVASAESQIRSAPGGMDSVAFGASTRQASVEELMARPSPGGAATVDFAAQSLPSMPVEMLVARASPGGEASIILGGDCQAWTTNSDSLGRGSMQAVAEVAAPVRQSPGGAASVSFGAEAITVSAEACLTRPSVGGRATVVLGGESADWCTNSGTLGKEAPLSAVEIQHHAPGGLDSVDLSTKTVQGYAVPVDVLRARPSPGGASTVVLGGHDSNWATSSRAHGVDNVVAEDQVRHAPADTLCLGAAEVVPSVQELRARPSPGGRASVVLGGDSPSWSTHSHAQVLGAEGARSAAGAAMLSTAQLAQAGTDSVKFGKAAESTTAEDLLKRPAPGGAGTLVLGDIGESPATGVSSSRFASGSNQNSGNCITDRSSTRLHQAPGGTSTICLGTYAPEAHVSTAAADNRSSRNVGKPVVDEPTTRLAQAPGGNSSICLTDIGISPVVGASGNCFADKNNQNVMNGITGRPTTKVRQAPGGASSLCLGDAQNENINYGNTMNQSLTNAKEEILKPSVAPERAAGTVLG